ncbi:Epoxyqueuosine reductase [Nitrospira japonica]|uniref:Epoxyqueuosine reductase n=1 Tax=Nitrospira japonica TaxID=1325564 RepID=A0A1W1I5S2_9BACT|nr:tRNA epoxyqueuosine(34) reductase QueG [Nitrospira japonica]SLM48291.1 Epoxyqueuosine reductase [Nitrospira japonica]
MSLSAVIRQEAIALGFDAVGISSVAQSHSTTLLDRLEEWLARRYHGTMAWLARDPSRRADPTVVLPNCRSIVSVGLNYDTGHRATEGPGFGRIARYAWGRDYHRTLGDRLTLLENRIKALAPTAATRTYVDTGPVMEKAWAQQAGLGWIGKHSNLVSAQYGSWLLLGEVLTTLELTPDEPATDLCGNCRLCIQACPTGAIVEPYVVDARRCISYLTIEFRGAADMIEHEIRQQMGNHIFGCDDCLDVCPYNLQAEEKAVTAFSPAPLSLAPRLSELAELTDETFTERFRDSPIRRTKRDGLLRNVTIAQHNETRHTKNSPLLSPAE